MINESAREQAVGSPVLAVENMTKLREKGGMRFELRIPALSVKKGEFLAIVGESGCGKSTLLDMLALVLHPDCSEVFRLNGTCGDGVDLLGQPPSALSNLRRSAIGYVLQQGGLLPYLTVQDNILLPCRLNGLDEKQALAQARQLAQTLGIKEHLLKKPSHLSGGQRQRVAIARALVHFPELILADEPTAAVDIHNARAIRDSFRRISKEHNIALIMVTHDRALVEGHADRAVSFALQQVSSSHTISTLIDADINNLSSIGHAR